MITVLSQDDFGFFHRGSVLIVAVIVLRATAACEISLHGSCDRGSMLLVVFLIFGGKKIGGKVPSTKKAMIK